MATQHAREWIAAETDRRLMHYFVEGYKTNDTVKKLVDTRELWFVPVANPDGYDYTFTPGNRLWRKNLRDNNGDGVIEAGVDGVDLNRNFPTYWNQDDEGSNTDTGSETYRGTAPSSEPETRAFDKLFRRMRFEAVINYHSAAMLLLYPFGNEVDLRSDDDPVFEALSGTDGPNPARPRTDDDSAIPGYDPDLGAELYTTNGETTDHLYVKYGTLAWTPELDTASSFGATGVSDFEFPDDEAKIQQVFEKNIPFALNVAKSAGNLAEPRNSGANIPGEYQVKATPAFVVDTFGESYGTPQQLEVNAKRSLGDRDPEVPPQRPRADLQRPDARSTAEASATARSAASTTTGCAPRSATWTSATPSRSGGRPGRRRASPSPSRSCTTRRARAAACCCWRPRTTRATARAARTPARSTSTPTSRRCGPTGSSRSSTTWTPRAASRRIRSASSRTSTPSCGTAARTSSRATRRRVPGTASKLAHDEIVGIRDFLNEGGRVFASGQNLPYAHMNAYPYPPGPTAPVPLTDDVFQYYFGAYRYQAGRGHRQVRRPAACSRSAACSGSRTSRPTRSADTANPSQFLHTELVPDRATYPDFASAPLAKYQLVGKQREEAIEGSFQAYAAHEDETWKRLTPRDRGARRHDDVRLPGQLGRRAGLRLRARGGPHRRPGQLDDAARGRRPRRADARVVRDRLELGAPVRRPLPDVRPGHGDVHAEQRHDRRRLVGPDR